MARRDVRVDTVPDPTIEEATDAIVRITSGGLCGSDLHLYEVIAPFMTEGDILGHDSTIAWFDRLDIVANVAGVGDGDLFADDPGDWRRVIAIDLTAVVDSTRLAVREMPRAGTGGVIINLASLIGLYPMAAAPVYAAAKAGVVNFTRSLADLGIDSGIRVCAICPELVDTPLARGMGEDALNELVLSGRILMPDDIALCVIGLIEDDTRAGAILQVTESTGAPYVE